MRKYIVFAWHESYPAGGLNDIQRSFDTYDKAVKYAAYNIGGNYNSKGNYLNKNCKGWDEIQIVDRDTWKVIEHYKA